MHPADIQAELKKRGITQKELAKKLGVCEVHISAVIHKRRPSDRVMRAISKAINKDHRLVFPEYYFREKKRKPRLASNDS